MPKIQPDSKPKIAISGMARSLRIYRRAYEKYAAMREE
jgi:hypothetical protein